MKLPTDEERLDVEMRWKKEMTWMMGTTLDLMQCVVNDVISSDEMSSNASSRHSSITTSSCDLGRILEEEIGVLSSSSDKVRFYPGMKHKC